MTLIVGGRSARYLASLCGEMSRAFAYAGQLEIKKEITHLDLNIASLKLKTKIMSRQLGDLYAQYRFSGQLAVSAQNDKARILALSREADGCIARLHCLEKRRGDLLQCLRA